MRTLFALFIAFGLSWSAFAQAGAPSPTPGTIDQVPDYVAFRLFFAAVAENSSPSPAETARQNDRLKPIQLTDVDKGVLVRTLAGFKNKFLNGRQVPPGTSLNAILQGTLAEMQGQMSPDGFHRLYAYVRLQKVYMKEAPLPPSTTLIIKKPLAPPTANVTVRATRDR
jgi:hypothetical protein